MVNRDVEVWGYGASSYSDLFALLPESVIARLEEMSAVESCTTWGEVADLGDEIFEEVLGLAGRGTIEEYTAHLKVTGSAPLPDAHAGMAEQFDQELDVPSPDDPFDIEYLPAFNDGDWPPSPLYLMTGLVPEEIIQQFGRVYDTNFNGTFTEFETKDQEAILAMCAELGMILRPSNVLQRLMSR